MKTTYIGQAGEDAAANYLQELGFKIIDRNWKTRWCEIDIIAQKDDVVHFVEVKFRQSARHGSGLEYITQAKQKQLKLAANFWVSENEYEGDYRIDAIGVDGETGSIEFVEDVIMG